MYSSIQLRVRAQSALPSNPGVILPGVHPSFPTTISHTVSARDYLIAIMMCAAALTILTSVGLSC